jgi:fatty acyl-ACP thioesterase B
VKRNVQSAHFFCLWFLLLDMYVCSTWVMMNQKTRRLSKMPNEVREEISPHFLERSAIKENNLVTQKIKKLDDSAQLVRSGLTV